jgi:hypothetical protein
MASDIPPGSPIRAIAAGGDGTVHSIGYPMQAWLGGAWQDTGTLGSIYYHGTAADAQGTLHTGSVEHTDERIGIIKLWRFDGRAWVHVEDVYSTARDPGTGASSPSLAIEPDGTLHLVWTSNELLPIRSGVQPPSKHWVSYSRREGGQWTGRETIFGPLEVGAGYWAPKVVVAPDGLVVAVWGDVNVDSKIRVYAAWAVGGDWSAPVALSPADGSTAHHTDVAVDREGRVHVIWAADGVYHVVGTRTD